MLRNTKGHHVRKRRRAVRAASAAAVAPALVLGGGVVAAQLVPIPDGSSAADASVGAPAASPDIPSTPFAAPASETRLVVRRGPGLATAAVSTRSGTLDIPDQALAAYQRAAAVLGSADPACHLQWELLAAVGRVESDHGRHGDSRLDSSGRARPAIVGTRLDGHGPVAAIRDTDAGELDGDRRWDRAVGPLQFIPSTWQLVGVDADADGSRDPQDIDDAALGAAVYLCSGDDDLASTTGRAAAVHRYNHDQEYVDLVLRIFESYVAAAANGVAAMPTANEVVDLAVAGVRARAAARPAAVTTKDDSPPRDDMADQVAAAWESGELTFEPPADGAPPTTEPTEEPSEEPSPEPPPTDDPDGGDPGSGEEPGTGEPDACDPDGTDQPDDGTTTDDGSVSETGDPTAGDSGGSVEPDECTTDPGAEPEPSPEPSPEPTGVPAE